MSKSLQVLDLLQQLTHARVNLGRAGSSLSTKSHLDFQLDHARARNAVHHPLDVKYLQSCVSHFGLPIFQLTSAANNRTQYLQRPDLGRKLCNATFPHICDQGAEAHHFDVAIVLGDGLSAIALEKYAPKVLDLLVPLLEKQKWKIAPITIVTQARVAIGDEIAQTLKADMVIVFIGERPGLSCCESMGIYLTWHPKVGIHDAKRNCISNIHQRGLTPEQAAYKLFYLANEAKKRQLTGVELKDESIYSQVPSTFALNLSVD